MNQQWRFSGHDGKEIEVHVPHTWNNIDGQDGGNDYWRGTCVYRKTFPKPKFGADERVYLEFRGVNASADVELNGQPVGTHDGGYSTFRWDVTDLLQEENQLTVQADNSVNDRVYPQKADFTFYGGIYRDVLLVIVNQDHFDMDYYGGPGLKVTPTVEDGDGRVRVETFHRAEHAEVKLRLLDADGRTVAEGEGTDATLTIPGVRLWDGVKDPYLYTCEAVLSVDGKEVDQVSSRFGVRSFSVDPQKGFFHKVYPKRALGYSEYGCEAMPNLHSSKPKRGDHTEEYQCVYHEYLARFLEKRPWMWAAHVWNMFDFAADARDQGVEPGMNHKGLVTFDRKTKKDSCYLYKAFWNQDDPFVHICGRRYVDRPEAVTTVKVYSNQPKVALYANGKLVEEKSGDKVFEFQVPMDANVKLKARAGQCTDFCSIRRVNEPNPAYKLQGKSSNSANWV